MKVDYIHHCKVEGCSNPVGRTSTGRCNTGGYCRVCKNLLHNYGITVVERDKMVEDQKGLCAICHTSLVFIHAGHSAAVDHCHDTGKVRGILCGSCNNGLGRFKDDINLLNSAIKYLEKSR